MGTAIALDKTIQLNGIGQVKMFEINPFFLYLIMHKTLLHVFGRMEHLPTVKHLTVKGALNHNQIQIGKKCCLVPPLLCVSLS